MSFLDRILAMNAAQSGAAFTAERPTAETALSGGRHPVLPDPRPHTVLGTPITGPWRDGQEHIVLGLGCFWGAEKLLWQIDGVESTSVGYAGGYTTNPTYREVCTGRTGHSEVVDVIYDPSTVSVREILKVALENHDPTQGDRQGNDVGSQYRSVIFPGLHLRRASGGRRLRGDHHGGHATVGDPGGGVLPRRGRAPAVPRQEPGRLLPGPRHRRDLLLAAPRRRGPQPRATGRCAAGPSPARRGRGWRRGRPPGRRGSSRCRVRGVRRRPGWSRGRRRTGPARWPAASSVPGD